MSVTAGTVSEEQQSGSEVELHVVGADQLPGSVIERIDSHDCVLINQVAARESLRREVSIEETKWRRRGGRGALGGSSFMLGTQRSTKQLCGRESDGEA